MKFTCKPYLVIVLSFLSINIFAQDIRLTLGTGVSAYLGDLMTDRVPILKQVSSDFSIGATYDVPSIPQFRARLNVSLLGVKGDDAKSSDYYRRARNLNFKSSVWEVALMGEYDLADRTVYNIVPYVFGGVGVYHFNPYTYDTIAGKVFLKTVGAEGQYLGLAGYPKPYNLTQINIPLGFGIRYEVSDAMTLGVEFNYRILFTDYLDDVSSKYVDWTKVTPTAYYTANNNYYLNLAERLGYRSSDSKYTMNLPRGNPGRKDAFYSIQITATFKLDGISFGGSPFGGGGYNGSRHYTY